MELKSENETKKNYIQTNNWKDDFSLKITTLNDSENGTEIM